MSHPPNNTGIWTDIKRSHGRFRTYLAGALPKFFLGMFLAAVGAALAVSSVLNLISGFQNKGDGAKFSFVLAAVLGLFSWWVGWKYGYKVLNDALDWRSIYRVPAPESIKQLQVIRQSRGVEAAANHSFPEHWKETLLTHSALYRRMPNELKGRLHQLTNVFLSEVQFGGGVLGEGKFGEDNMVLIAGEACVLILGRDYQDFRKLELVELRVNPIHEQGVLWEVVILGQASPSTVMLHWETAMVESMESGSGNNVILHEFAHIMDYADDGTCQSILGKTGSEEAHQWEALLEEEFPKLVEAHKRGEDHVLPPYTIKLAPSHVTMRGIKVQRPEFFSCATEVFFGNSARLQNECPKIYEAMKAFYRLDPAEW